MRNVFIIGSGPFAQELEVYLSKTYPDARVYRVSDADEVVTWINKLHPQPLERRW